MSSMDTNNRDLVKRSALEKLDSVVLQAIEKYEYTRFKDFWSAISLPSTMSEDEKHEIKENYKRLTSSRDGFLSYCKNRGIDCSSIIADSKDEIN